MRIKNITLTALLILAGNAFAQEAISRPQTNLSYLDSIKKTFIKDNIASCVDSLWMKELTNLDLYNDLETDIKTINLDQKVEYELPTELLKKRLKEMDSKSPFNIEYNQGLENIIKSFLKNRKKSYERLMPIRNMESHVLTLVENSDGTRHWIYVGAPGHADEAGKNTRPGYCQPGQNPEAILQFGDTNDAAGHNNTCYPSFDQYRDDWREAGDLKQLLS